jgi:hypothetical protein
MDVPLVVLLMFLLLSYLLYHRSAQAISKQYPAELEFQIGHSVYLKGLLVKRLTTAETRPKAAVKVSSRY